MRVLIVEDHALFREGLSLILKQLDADIQLECAESKEQALGCISSDAKFDLILLDYHLKDVTGQELIELIHPMVPDTPIIILSAEQDQSLIQQILASGAKGFITKASSAQVMICAIQLVLQGGVYVPPELLNPVSQSGVGASPGSSNLASKKPIAEPKQHSHFKLTERQLDVFKQMQEGLSNKEIAKVLGMSPSTVKVHVAAILRELNVKNRTQAVNIAKNLQIESLS